MNAPDAISTPEPCLRKTRASVGLRTVALFEAVGATTYAALGQAEDGHLAPVQTDICTRLLATRQRAITVPQ